MRYAGCISKSSSVDSRPVYMAVHSPVEKALAYSILARGLRSFGSGQRAIGGGCKFEPLSTKQLFVRAVYWAWSSAGLRHGGSTDPGV